MASDIFLKLVAKSGKPVEGGSQDAAFRGQIEISSFALTGPAFSRDGSKKPPSPSATKGEDGKEVAAPAKPKAICFNISKDVDRSTPVLVQTYSKNLGSNTEPYTEATVSFRLPHDKESLVFLTLTFTDLFLTKYDVELGEESSIPKEKIEFAFKQLKIEYTAQDDSGGAMSAVTKKFKTAQYPPP